MKENISLWERLKVYRLINNIWIVLILTFIFFLSIAALFVPSVRESEIGFEISVAIFTSLLATILAISAETYVNFRDRENERILMDIHAFGIEKLELDKEKLLKRLLEECDNIIWISGYRLHLTNIICDDIAKAIYRGAEVMVVICPPWNEAYSMVYDKEECIIDNYLNVFYTIYNEKIKMNNDIFEIRFTKKPLFSDTYKIDQQLVSGPYMHNSDPNYHRLMAKDFFSYNIKRKSRLYGLVSKEFQEIFLECEERLCWESFNDIYHKIKNGNFEEQEKRELLRSACEPVNKKDNWRFEKHFQTV